MHYLIRLLVPGENEREAKLNAVEFAEHLCDQEYGADFDWFTFEGRWGSSEPQRLSTKKGQKLVDDAMKSNRNEYDRAMAHVRYMMDHFSDDQIFNEDFGTVEEQRKLLKDNEEVSYLTRWQFGRIGAPGNSNDCFLYAKDWPRVEHNKDLQSVIDHYGKDKLWVVEGDFHN